jgi:hypothetical protein
MNKQEQIELKKIKPIEVGDYVLVKTEYNKDETVYLGKGKIKAATTKTTVVEFKTQGTVIEITEDKFKIKVTSVRVPFELEGIVDSTYDKHNQTIISDKSIVYPTFLDCGANPFCKEKNRITFYNQDIQSILWKMGYNKKDLETERDWQKINFDPYVIDSNGEKQYYQRGLVWTVEQKQLLIESIYNDIEIGKFLLRHNHWSRMEKEESETGTMHSYDCVDGKQRLNTLFGFVHNEYPDSHGNYWDDLSGNAQRRFFNYSNLSLGVLSESAADEDVIDNFLTLNFTGVPMSQNHIEYIKSIKMNNIC